MGCLGKPNRKRRARHPSTAMKKGATYVCVALLAPLLLFAVGYMHWREGSMSGRSADTLLLLLPDAVDVNTPAVREWLDAASEEGLHLKPIHDSEFLDPLAAVHAAGVILPDQLHRSANDVLVGELYRYVRAGGNLMVVYDACTWDLNGRFPPGASRLSGLVGVHYSLYDLYDTKTMEPAQGVPGVSAMPRRTDIRLRLISMAMSTTQSSAPRATSMARYC